MISSIRLRQSSVKKHWLRHSWRSSNQHPCTCWRGLAFRIVNPSIMCTSCHNEPLDFPDWKGWISKSGAWALPLQNKAHLPSFSSSSQKSHTWNAHLLTCVPYIIKGFWLKFQSSFAGISISDVHQNQTAAWTLTFHYRFSASATRWEKQSGEIHHGGPAMDDKCAHVHVKGQVWRWPSDMAPKPAELAAVITPLPAQPAGWRPAKCHICPANGCQRSTPITEPVHYKRAILVLAHNSCCHGHAPFLGRQLTYLCVWECVAECVWNDKRRKQLLFSASIFLHLYHLRSFYPALLKCSTLFIWQNELSLLQTLAATDCPASDFS